MKKLLLLAAAAVISVGCDSSLIEGRKAYKQYFEDNLKGPSSLVIYNESFEKDGEHEVEWKIDYGAKNSYGGMVRNTRKFTTIGGHLMLVDGDIYIKE